MTDIVDRAKRQDRQWESLIKIVRGWKRTASAYLVSGGFGVGNVDNDEVWQGAYWKLATPLGGKSSLSMNMSFDAETWIGRQRARAMMAAVARLVNDGPELERITIGVVPIGSLVVQVPSSVIVWHNDEDSDNGLRGMLFPDGQLIVHPPAGWGGEFSLSAEQDWTLGDMQFTHIALNEVDLPFDATDPTAAATARKAIDQSMGLTDETVAPADA